ncbi:hypothetical protein EON65_07450 [archaeon]|nr:MAG: hypothetical protein EON65_07450 [archaeon]
MFEQYVLANNQYDVHVCHNIPATMAGHRQKVLMEQMVVLAKARRDMSRYRSPPRRINMVDYTYTWLNACMYKCMCVICVCTHIFNRHVCLHMDAQTHT